MAKFSGNRGPPTRNATVSGWLEANKKSLAALREAVKRTHYYNPIIPEKTDKGSKGMYSALLPGLPVCREVAAAFAARAMLSLGHGNTAEAWQDLLACHRLGRLVGRGSSLIEGLIGVPIEQIASRAEIAFLDRAKPGAKVAESCLRDLLALPPLAEVAEKIECERFVYLDNFMQINQRGLEYLQMIGGDAKLQEPLVNFMLDEIDWDPALETGNKCLTGW